MGHHNLTAKQAIDFARKALIGRQKKYGKFKTDEKIILIKEKNGKWHGYYECYMKMLKNKNKKTNRRKRRTFNPSRRNSLNQRIFLSCELK